MTRLYDTPHTTERAYGHSGLSSTQQCLAE